MILVSREICCDEQGGFTKLGKFMVWSWSMGCNHVYCWACVFSKARYLEFVNPSFKTTSYRNDFFHGQWKYIVCVCIKIMYFFQFFLPLWLHYLQLLVCFCIIRILSRTQFIVNPIRVILLGRGTEGADKLINWIIKMW